ncbi:MAG: pirin family protein [Acidimicrobiales bacterium]|nr:pirin family protein [Acidimicrobiales bacterium]
MNPVDTIELRRSDQRFHTDLGWLDSRHSFSFGHHYRPDETGHGLLIVSNDDRVAPGGGFASHAHRDMEIVSWVLEGSLEHRDSEGNHGVVLPGQVQRMSAGTGVVHSETNHSAVAPLRFLQMWVVPDTRGLDPSYEQRDMNDALAEGGLVPVASGRDHPGAVRIHQAGAAMWVGRLDPGETVELPDSAFVHLFVAIGEVVFDGHRTERLGAGDAVRLRSHGPARVRADQRAEIIIWESDAEVRR